MAFEWMAAQTLDGFTPINRQSIAIVAELDTTLIPHDSGKNLKMFNAVPDLYAKPHFLDKTRIHKTV